MLRTLLIRDIVLIDRLELNFHPHLCVLTGETGAGKSILLDALGLALGSRADARFVRHGARQASVTAEFEVAMDDAGNGGAIQELMREHGLELEDGPLLLRRVLGADGRSRAFINDQPVSVGLLRNVGKSLVEIHGQFENLRLLDPSSHMELLDAFGGLGEKTSRVNKMYQSWRQAIQSREDAERALAEARRDEAFLRHCLDELISLAPEAGEEETLANKRTLLMNGEKIMESIGLAASELTQGAGVESSLRAAQRHLERISEKIPANLDAIVEALDRAALEATDALAELERIGSEMDLDPQQLEGVEERLFSLRALSRKHGVEIDALPALMESMETKLTALADGGKSLDSLTQAEQDARSAFVKLAESLSQSRKKKAAMLDKRVSKELKPLKLGDADFGTTIVPLEEKEWGPSGMDRVMFEVSTNPGTPPGPLSRISSGGELARFTLALKVALADAYAVPTMVFDEVDSGVGGAVAAAVGERLDKLSEDFQVLVVTHSPQVASKGAYHWRVSKGTADDATITSIDQLTEAERKEEIARMLAGAQITDEARAAADSLLRGHEP